MSTIDQLVSDLLRLGAQPLLVVTGAGISVASGIPTFRGSDVGAVWGRDPMEMGTRRFFQRDPLASWRWYAERFGRLREALPNPAHAALVELERWHASRGGDFLLVTQNIDTLHEQAGTEALVKVHGSADRLRCPTPGCRRGAPRGSLPLAGLPGFELDALRTDPGHDRLPRCPDCDAVLRPHVLWFDECYDEHEDYQIERVDAYLDQAAMVCFVGTSMSVGITELIYWRGIRRGVPLYHLDPEGPAGAEALRHVAGRAEQLLPRLLERLADRGPDRGS